LFRFADQLSELEARKRFAFEDWSSRYANNSATSTNFVLPEGFDGLFCHLIHAFDRQSELHFNLIASLLKEIDHQRRLPEGQTLYLARRSNLPILTFEHNGRFHQYRTFVQIETMSEFAD
jgi:hypothetical protein